MTKPEAFCTIGGCNYKAGHEGPHSQDVDRLRYAAPELRAALKRLSAISYLIADNIRAPNFAQEMREALAEARAAIARADGIKPRSTAENA